MRIFALSDIHVDYPFNEQWVANLSTQEFTEDVLILAGDVSHHIREVETTLDRFVRRFKKVAFVPGNHDLWITKNERITSIKKFDQVCELANNIGATTKPVTLSNVSLVPLFSWYDYSFGLPSEQIKEVWTDYIACKWPNAMNNPEVTDYFLSKNDPILDGEYEMVISLSHFLPRIDVMPSFIPQSKRYLYPVLGSQQLDTQIRKLESNIHIYGHSHVNRNVEIEGITYINNAFGYPSEERITAKKLCCIYET